eukprot:403340468
MLTIADKRYKSTKASKFQRMIGAKQKVVYILNNQQNQLNHKQCHQYDLYILNTDYLSNLLHIMNLVLLQK